MSAIEKVPFIPEASSARPTLASAPDAGTASASDAVALSWRVVAATRRIPAVERVI
jgi:hypothetical protein